MIIALGCSLNTTQGDQIERFFSDSANIGSSESSPKMATFSFICLIQFLHSYLKNKFQNMVCCRYLQVSKVD
jgi:hypothetical protein